jgi:hypothetical protein
MMLQVSFEDTSHKCLYVTKDIRSQSTATDPVTVPQEAVIPFNMYHDVSLRFAPL